MEEARTDRWRICLEQSLKTVCDHMNIHYPLSLPSVVLFLHLPILFSLHYIISLLCCNAESQKLPTRLITSNREPAAQKRGERPAGQFASPSFLSSNYIQP